MAFPFMRGNWDWPSMNAVKSLSRPNDTAKVGTDSHAKSSPGFSSFPLNLGEPEKCGKTTTLSSFQGRWRIGSKDMPADTPRTRREYIVLPSERESAASSLPGYSRQTRHVWTSVR